MTFLCSQNPAARYDIFVVKRPKKSSAITWRKVGHFCAQKSLKILRNNLPQGMKVSYLLDLDANHRSGKSDING